MLSMHSIMCEKQNFWPRFSLYINYLFIQYIMFQAVRCVINVLNVSMCI